MVAQSRPAKPDGCVVVLAGPKASVRSLYQMQAPLTPYGATAEPSRCPAPLFIARSILCEVKGKAPAIKPRVYDDLGKLFAQFGVPEAELAPFDPWSLSLGMATSVFAVPTLGDLRQHVLETLCKHDLLDPKQTLFFQGLVTRAIQRGDFATFLNLLADDVDLAFRPVGGSRRFLTRYIVLASNI